MKVPITESERHESEGREGHRKKKREIRFIYPFRYILSPSFDYILIIKFCVKKKLIIKFF
jgi:hypothetical protein